MAAGVVAWGGAGGAGRLLEAAVGGSVGSAGVASGPAANRAAEPARSVGDGADRPGVSGPVPEPSAAARGDVVHGDAGGIPGIAGALQRATGGLRGDANCGTDAERDGRVDRVL